MVVVAPAALHAQTCDMDTEIELLNPDTYQEDLRVELRADAEPSSDEPIEEYQWDFNDGTTRTVSDDEVEHTYESTDACTTSGECNITLIVSTSGSACGSDQLAVNFDTGVRADFETRDNEGRTVTFDAGASSPSVGESISSYEWSFGHDGETGTGRLVTHTFPDPSKQYSVELVVTDTGGQTDTAEEQVALEPYDIDFTVDYQTENTAVFTVTSEVESLYNDGKITSLVWIYGDGNDSSSETDPVSVAHTYPSGANSYSVTLVAYDDGYKEEWEPFSTTKTVSTPFPVEDTDQGDEDDDDFTPGGGSSGVDFGDYNPGEGLVPCFGVDNPETPENEACTYNDLIALVNGLITYIVQIGTGIAALLFAYAGFLYLTAGGNKGKARKAKTIFKNVIYGFIIILAAWLVVNTILAALGVGDAFNMLE